MVHMMLTEAHHNCGIMLSFVVIPCDDQVPLELQTIESSSSLSIEREIQNFLIDNNDNPRYHHDDDIDDESFRNIISTLLIRSRPKQRRRRCHTRDSHSGHTEDESSNYPPLYAYHIPLSSRQQQIPLTQQPQLRQKKNIRATRLAMACGHWSIRFYGTIVLTITTATSDSSNSNLNRITEAMFHEIQTVACHCGPDLRDSIIASLLTNDEAAVSTENTIPEISNDSAMSITEWIGNAAQEQYHDRAIVQQFQNLFSGTDRTKDDSDTDGEVDDDDVNSSLDKKSGDDELETTTLNGHAFVQADANFVSSPKYTNTDIKKQQCLSSNNTTEVNDNDIASTIKHPSMASPPTFCYTCRRPATVLCSNCNGVYFCNDICQMNGWTHGCLCSIWKIYTDRRDAELANVFPSHHTANDIEDADDSCTNESNSFWYEAITKPRECQLSSAPYLTFLSEHCKVNVCDSSNNGSLGSSSWWNTEVDGWNYGHGFGACQIDIQQRRSYAQGFYPISEIPIEQNIFKNPNFDRSQWKFNDVGLLYISSWNEYYQLRQIPRTSPIALLMTYPLTLYYAIVRNGIVPCTIAYQIERRPLRIHIVGVEKELNFLDIYKELAFLLPTDFYVELVFCIRPDMIPMSLVNQQHDTYDLSSSRAEHSDKRSSKMLYSIQLMETMHISIVCGIYGDESSLHPNFDCGGGPPDMIMAYNAGLYAYESWRHVINYLYNPNTNAVGICSDYNEHSAVQCAAIIGGIDCQNSVAVNPFRQPRAMPVYSMNLPQYSNSFLYVVNEQSLE